MLSRALLCLLPTLCFGALSGGYNYDRCNSTYGPSKWPGTCATQTQGTPINLCGAQAFPTTAPTPVITGYNTPRNLNVSSDGTSITVTVLDNVPTVVVGNLAYLVGRGAANNSVHTWKLQQMHIHWGRLGLTNEGSEHFLNGQAFAAEAHFVHYNARFASFGAAVASGDNDALLVVGVFLQAGSSDVSTISTIANSVSSVSKTPMQLPSQVTLNDLWSGAGNFYSYGGGLTTPTCLEIVTWIVMVDPKPISLATLNMLWALSTNPPSTDGELVSKYGNYRPLQALNGRNLYFTGGATSACGTVTEPTFDCTAKVAGTSSAVSLVSSVSLQATLFILAFATYLL